MKVEVLSDLRYILKLTNLYNKYGVYIGSVRIPDSVIFFMISLPSSYMCLLFFWAAVEEHFDMEKISGSLACTIGMLQPTIAYISLAVKTDLVISTIDHLQQVVEKSK